MTQPTQPQCEVIILTALPIEYQAVLRYLEDPQEAIHPLGTVYDHGRCGETAVCDLRRYAGSRVRASRILAGGVRQLQRSWFGHMMHPIYYHSCFISYSGKDNMLACRLPADLQDRGVRCWLALEDIKIGDKIRARIDEAIHLQDKLLLLLSEHAIASTWVEDEVKAALQKEDRQQREVLFPIRLDDRVMQTGQP